MSNKEGTGQGVSGWPLVAIRFVEGVVIVCVILIVAKCTNGTI